MRPFFESNQKNTSKPKNTTQAVVATDQKKQIGGGDFSLLSSFFGWNATSSDPFITINFRYLRPKHLGKNHAQIFYGLLCS